MKSIVWFAGVALMFLACGQSFAQLQKGTFLVGGNIQASRSNNNSTLQGTNSESKTFQFALSPAVSYFVTDKLAVGIVTPYNYSRTTNSDRTDGWTSTYSLGPTVRYYFSFGAWAVFPIASYTYGWSTSKQKYAPPVDFLGYYQLYSNTTTFNGGAGLTYFLNRHVGIEGILSYSHTSSSTDFKDDTVYDYTQSDIIFSIGLKVYIGKP